MADFKTIQEQNIEQAQQFANALYNVQLGTDTLDQVLLEANQLASMRAAFDRYYFYSYGSTPVADVASMMVENFGIVEGDFGLTAADVAAAEGYVAAALGAASVETRGAAAQDVINAFSSLTGGVFGAAAAAWNAEVAVAIAYTGEANVEPGTENEVQVDFYLTANQDILAGSSSDDMFYADVVQANGPQVNSLGTGDAINGGAGDDTLAAMITEGVFMGGGNMPIQPRVNDVETISLQAINSNIGLETNDLNLTQVLDLVNVHADLLGDVDNITLETDVYFNAKNVVGVEFIGSDHSDANLTIQDLTTVRDDGSVALTSAITVGMAYTANADSRWAESDLHVYFDQDYLLSGVAPQPSKAFYWLLDEDGHDATVGTANYEPLQNIDREGVSFQLTTLDGTVADFGIIIGETTTDSYTDANTWQEYVDLLNAELAARVAAAAPGSEDELLSTLSFAVDLNALEFTNTDTLLNVPVPAMVLTDSANGTFALASLGFIRDLGATGEFDVWGRVDNEIVGPLADLITVNVELEKAGRGGDGGELVIGGMNKDGDNEWGDGSDTTPAGVEQFDVVVNGGADLPNSISSLRSTNNALRVVNIDSAAGVTVDDAASLQIGNSNTAHLTDIFLPTFQNALKDVQILNATAFKGDLTVFAGITDETIDKYLDLEDIAADTSADDVPFIYTGGAGNDDINVQVDTDVVAHEDFTLDIVTGEGNDSVTLAVMNYLELPTLAFTPFGEDTNWYADQVILDNLSINTGAGNDVVWVPGSGNVNIMTGSGDDVVYADNTALPRDINTYSQFSAWLYNTVDFQDINNIINESESDVNNVYDIMFTNLTVSFMGHDVTVALNGSADGSVTDLQINNAIKAAVNNGPNGGALNSDNPGLSAVLFAYDGEANDLVIESKIDGNMDAPFITLTGPTTLTASQLSQLNAAWGTNLTAANAIAAINAEITAFNNRGDYDARVANDLLLNDIVGNDLSIHTSDNMIEGGTGDDVFVLGLGELSNDTLVYEGYSNGFDCVYNFDSMWMEEQEVLVNDPAVRETFTISFADFTGGSNTITIDGIVVDLNGLANAQGVIPAQDVANAVAVTNFVASNYSITGYTPGDTSVTFLHDTLTGDQVDVVVTVPVPADAAATTVVITDGTDAFVAATAASFNVVLAGQVADVDGTVDLFGDTIAFTAGDGPVTLAAAIAAGPYTGWTASLDANGTTVSFTADTPGLLAPGVPTAILTQIATDNPTIDTDFGWADQAPAALPGFIDVTFGVSGSWVNGTDQTGSQSIQIIPAGPSLGLDMIDYTAYDVDAVVVEGYGVVEGALFAGADYVYLDQDATNPGEYNVTEWHTVDGLAEPFAASDDSLLGTIGVIDFGFDQMGFTPDTFVI